MRFRPANISLINRRHYLPRLRLTPSSKRQMQKQKPPQRFEDVDRVTPYQLTVGRLFDRNPREQPFVLAMKMATPDSFSNSYIGKTKHQSLSCQHDLTPSFEG
jgi:hypothetical protein